ncbi:MAG: PqqD family peptide modification chaperone [Phycisphaerales bacterium]|nr:PqqD family peptide modification chaperone [Phycisphaerales bacterium]
MAEISRTFSELWYRVADFRPRLSAHLVVRRHTYRSQTWFVLGDPTSTKFYRFNAAAYRFLGLLDGQRTVQEAWDVCNAQLGDDAPTQRDCLDLLAQLQMYGLLRNDLPVDVQRLRERIVQIREQRYQELTGKYLFWTVPLFNPERFLAKFANVARVVFGRWGFAALGILLLLAIRAVVPRWEELTGSLNSVIAIDNLFWLSFTFLVLKAIHELGHGFACKAYGGRVTEIGIMFMIVLPIPYCDATTSWAFANKWHRILVSSAGVMSELAVASIAAMIWAATDAGFVHTLAYNVMFVASVATVVFNINPLLRYDGYYILADLTEIPNLATRSQELLKWMTRRYLFGVKGEPCPPLHDRTEGAIMVTHAALAFPYRLVVMVSIVAFVAQKYFVFGLLLALFGTIMWLAAPIVKGLSYVLSEPTLQVVRVRAVAVSFGLVLAAVAFVGLAPMPARVAALGVVEPLDRKTYRVPHEGFLDQFFAVNGQRIAAAEPLFAMSNPEMEQQHKRAVAGVELERLRRDAGYASSAAEGQVGESLYHDAVDRLDAIEEAMSEMYVEAPFDGYVIAPDLDTRVGSYFKAGDTLLLLATLDDMVIRAYVDDRDFAWLFPDGLTEGATASVRVKGRLYDSPDQVVEFDIDVQRSGYTGERSLPFQSLGLNVSGGGIAVDPTDNQGQRTLSPQWLVTLRPRTPLVERGSGEVEPGNAMAALPGTRARIRFSRPAEPLLTQWVRRLRQALTRRFEI